MIGDLVPSASIVAPLLFVPLATAGLVGLGIQEMTFPALLGLKTVYGTVLGALIRPYVAVPVRMAVQKGAAGHRHGGGRDG